MAHHIMKSARSARSSLRLKIKEFKDNTIEPTLFHIENVIGDDACFYRSIANAINYQYNFNSDIKAPFNNTGEWLENIKDFNEIDEYMWGKEGILQEELAREIQQQIRKWLYTNKDKKVENLGLTYEELIMMTHELDIESYNELYKHFAGDEDYIMFDTGRKYKKGPKKGKRKLKRIEIQNRWGGLPEQYAISEILQVPIMIYTTQKYNEKTRKIENGQIRNNKAVKNVRFRIFQIIGEQYSDKQPLNILWKKLKENGHYYALCPK